MSESSADDMDDILRAVVFHELATNGIKQFKGDGMELKQALGSFVFAYMYGWRALYSFTSPATADMQGQRLSMDFKKVCPEYTELTSLSDRFLNH